VPTIAQSLNAARQLIRSSSSPRIDSEALLCHVLKCNTAHLMTWPDKELDQHDVTLFNQLINKRIAGMPIAYIIGEKEFWSLSLKVTDATLIPRPETELIVETLLSKFSIDKHLDLIDLGTGSGAIAITLAHTMPKWRLTATDISSAALKIATNNAEQYQLDNIEFIQSDWFDSLENQHFDIVISNPPYIADYDTHLNEGDVRFEPRSALVSGATGMDDINIIASQAKDHLRDNGWLILEHGYDQKELVFNCLTEADYINIIQCIDLAGNPRVTMCQFKNEQITS